jgi:hypothetical protein
MTKKTGRPETIANIVRAAVQAAGAAGATYEEIKAAHPHLRMKQIRHCTANNLAAGELFRLGGYRTPRFFATGTPLDLAQAAADADALRRRKTREANEARYMKSLLERRKLERAAKSSGQKPVNRLEKAPQWWFEIVARVEAEPAQTIRQLAEHFGRRDSVICNAVDQLHMNGMVISRKGTKRALVFPVSMTPEQIEPYFPPKPEKKPSSYVKKLVRTTRAINGLADKYRGTAAQKERLTVQIVGMESAPRIVSPAPRGRYDVDPQSLSGLSKLPIGVYAEPATRWASVLTDKRAA